MIYEFIATITAGFAMAGMALIVRHLSQLIFKIKLPKWLIPLFAFIGIMGFQIHQEYHWAEQKQMRIESKGMHVIKTVQGSVWYRPWSYVKPQTVSFMAVDIKNMETNQLNPNLKRTEILIADRLKGISIPQIFDCESGKRADIISNQKPNWIDMDKKHELYRVICQKIDQKTE